MEDMFRLLLVLHFLGMTMGFAAGWAGLATGQPSPAISRVADIGLLILWATGLIMLFTKWGGFGAVPGTFHLKLTLVVLLTGMVGFMHSQQRKALAGDKGAMARMQVASKITFITAIGIVAAAVWTFN